MQNKGEMPYGPDEAIYAYSDYHMGVPTWEEAFHEQQEEMDRIREENARLRTEAATFAEIIMKFGNDTDTLAENVAKMSAALGDAIRARAAAELRYAALAASFASYRQEMGDE